MRRRELGSARNRDHSVPPARRQPLQWYVTHYMVRPGKQHVLPGLIAALTAAFLISLWPSFQGMSGPAVEVGDEAPTFQLMSDTGQPIQLKDFRGKFVILNF